MIVSDLLRAAVRRALRGQDGEIALRIELARARYLGVDSPEALTQVGREALHLLTLAHGDASNALAVAEHRERLRTEEFEAWKSDSIARVNAAVARIRRAA